MTGGHTLFLGKNAAVEVIRLLFRLLYIGSPADVYKRQVKYSSAATLFTASSVDRLGNDIQVSVPIWKYLLIGSFMASPPIIFI